MGCAARSPPCIAAVAASFMRGASAPIVSGGRRKHRPSALGDDRFLAAIERLTARRIRAARRGPKTKSKEAQGDLLNGP
jgi:hypothetical protein